MRLSWNEVRARAAAFAEDWKDAAYEKGETQSFYNAFFDVFGVRRRNVARYEAHVAKLDNRSGFIDLFWPGVLLVEQKSAGRDLKAAYVQAGDCIVADIVALRTGSGGADAPGEGGLLIVGHGRGSLFGPRGWAVVQEAAAAAFLQGSRAAEQDRARRNAL